VFFLDIPFYRTRPSRESRVLSPETAGDVAQASGCVPPGNGMIGG